MNSALLARQLDQIFGPDGEQSLRRMLDRLPRELSPLGEGLQRLLQLADLTYTRYAETNQAQSWVSGDVFSDWNWTARRIDSGRGWLRLLGYGESESVDALDAWQECLHPEDRTAVLARLDAHLRKEAPLLSVECRMRTGSGAWKWILLRGLVTQRDAAGMPLRLLVMHRDIGEAKRAEARLVEARDAAEAASRARGAFLANVSHEIRTPMNAIIGMAELVAETQLNSEQRHYVNTVRSSAESLLTILNDVLDLSKIEAGKLTFETIPFSLTDLVLEAARVIAVSAHKKGLEVAVDIDPDVPQRLIGDPTRLRQVLTNLLGNAVKFTESGEIVVEVAMDRGDAIGVGVALRFAVRDTGIGVPLDKQHSIFEAFAQADDSTTRRFGGTGLGLTISTRLVQMMGGRIWLESAPGKGASFMFDARFGVEAGGMSGVLPQCFRGRRALLAEPESAAARCIGKLLGRLGIRYETISDGAADLLRREAAGGDPFTLVLVSASLPEPVRAALVDAWKPGSPGLIFLLTTQASPDLQARLRQLKSCRQLVKPVGMTDLVEALMPDAELGTRTELEPAFELAPFDFGVADSGPAASAYDVLLVEDNPVNQELARRLLERRAYRVTVANNGAEALEFLERRSFDAILMDMQMPVLGGIEATEAIRAREMRRSWVISSADGFRTAYIIAMTANAMAGDRERCLAAGMNDYVAKPVRAEQLYAALDRAVGADTAVVDGGGTSDSGPARILDLAAAVNDVGDRELLVRLAKMLLADLSAHVERIAAAIASRDAGELQMHAHTLKGLMATFHADAAQCQAARIEALARDIGAHSWDECRRLEVHLGIELDRVRPLLERFVA